MNVKTIRNGRRCWIALLLLGTIGCWHRNMSTCEVDSVLQAILAGDGRGEMLALHETVFQKSSESSSGGITHISGETETRISVYDLASGALLARIPFGPRTKKGIALLGWTAGRLWLYSTDPALGLHARNPRTLEVRLTQKQILAATPELAGNLVSPPWNGISTYVLYDTPRNRLLVTDMQGFRWEISPQNLKGHRLPGGVEMPGENRIDPLSSSTSFRGDNLYMASNLRHTLELANRPLSPNLSYLEGQLLCETDETRVLARLRRELDLASERLAKLRTRPEEPGGDASRGRVAESDARSEARLALRDEERRVETLTDALQRVTNEGRYSGSAKLLQPDDDSFYIVHRSSLAADARMLVSRLELPPDGLLRERWTHEIPAVFFNPSSARASAAYKALFSSGDPDFSFRFFAQRGNRLVMIHMLHLLCLDSASGRVLWFKRL